MPSWSQVGTTWGQLEPTWTNLGPTCANLTSRRHLVSSLWAKFVNLGSKMAPRWGSQRGPPNQLLGCHVGSWGLRGPRWPQEPTKTPQETPRDPQEPPETRFLKVLTTYFNVFFCFCSLIFLPRAALPVLCLPYRVVPAYSLQVGSAPDDLSKQTIM